MPSLKRFLDNLTAEQLADRLDLAMEGASLGIWDWDLRDNSVQFDRRWCEMLGLDHEAVPMELSSWESRVHPDDIAQCYADIQAYLGGETPFYQNIHRMKHADGHWVYILDRGRVSGWDESGEAIRFTGTHFDCTATERARRLVEAEQERLAGLVRGLPTAVGLFNAEGELLASSTDWDAWFAAQGAKPDDAPLGAPAPSAWREALDRALVGRATPSTETHVHDGLQGSGRVLRWSVRPWEDADGEPQGAIVRFDDVTGELAVRAHRAHTARLSALGQMAGGVAHELNTPLQSLLMDLSTAREDLDAPAVDREGLIEVLDDALDTVRYLTEVVSGMRTLSRDAKRDPLQDVPIATALLQVRRLSESRLQSRGVTLLTDDADAAWTVRARPSELAQVLVNLVSNATDAVERQDERWIRIEAEQGPAGTEIRVVDSGPGIPEEKRAAIMSPFYTTKAPGEGTGLGLSLSQSLAERMGATLTLIHDASHTTFAIRFPPPEGP